MNLSIKLLCAVTACIFSFTGCTIGTGIEALLQPPKLSKQQSEINQALISDVGSNIKLKYPKSGAYRSAFLIENIDDEPTDEAIVFYEKTGISTGESTLRMNILDQRGGKWVSVFDHSGGGTEIDKIMLSKLGGLETIIVGYTLINQNEKMLKAYSYSDGVLETLYSDKYSVMDVVDIDNKSGKELVLITSSETNADPNISTANATKATVTVASAKTLTRQGDKFVLGSEVAMNETAVDYTGIVRGDVGVNKTPALFIDSSMGDGQIQTQILYCVDGILQNPLEQIRDLMLKTSRPMGYASTDIDQDGVVEIPTLTPFPGYETAEKADQVCSTDWLVFERNALVKKNSGYYNINDGYCFMLPSRWQGMVTVKEDLTNDEIVFYKYEGSITDNMTELMRISVMKMGENYDKISDGYSVIYSQGQMDYMVKLSKNESEPLVLTMSEIMFNFYVL